MDEKSFKFEIVTPFRVVYSGEVNYVRAPGIDGYFGVLVRHTPFLASLQIGEIKVELGREARYFATSGGFVEVLPHSVTILAETAEEATEIDVGRAEAARERALKRLTEKSKDTDLERARVALMRAINRITVASKI